MQRKGYGTATTRASTATAGVNDSGYKSAITDHGESALRSDRQLPDAALVEKWFGCSPYGPKFTVTVLEQVWVPASQTLYMKLA